MKDKNVDCKYENEYRLTIEKMICYSKLRRWRMKDEK